MALLDAIYPSMPTIVQNGIITARGMYLKHIRYTKKTWGFFEGLQKSQWYSNEQSENLQLEKLQYIYNLALNHCPFYKETYSHAGLVSNSITALHDLQKLPIISKEEFRQHNELFYNKQFDTKDLWAAYTSGTSGKPLKAYYTHEDMQERFAFLERLYHWYNPSRWRRRASFTGKLVVRTDTNPVHVFRKNMALRQCLFSSHHMHQDYMNKYISDLISCKPEQIDGILSPIYIIARHILANGLEGQIKPAVVIPTSETLWTHIRKSIEDAYCCKVANQYGSQEGAPLAYECPEGGFHICPESGIFEVMGPDNLPVKPGQLGRLVVTSFISRATPLIRYDIGDSAILSEKKCTCGRASPCFEAILGRVDDMLYSSEMGLIPRVDSALKGIPNSVVFSQLAQIEKDTFELRLEVDKNIYRNEHAEIICHNLIKYIGHTSKVSVKIMDKLPIGPGGKIKAMVNESKESFIKTGDLWNQFNADYPKS